MTTDTHKKMEFELSQGDGVTLKKNSLDTLISRELEGTGLKFTTVEERIVQPDGTVKIKQHRQFDGVVEGYEAVYKFLAGNPCWFMGCEQLRSELDTALENAKASGCSECEARSIKRRFIPKIKAAIDAHVAAGGSNPKTIQAKPHIKINRVTKSTTSSTETINTGTVEVSGSGGESLKGTGTLQQLLRRAANGIKKIFGVSKTKGESSK